MLFAFFSSIFLSVSEYSFGVWIVSVGSHASLSTALKRNLLLDLLLQHSRLAQAIPHLMQIFGLRNRSHCSDPYDLLFLLLDSYSQALCGPIHSCKVSLTLALLVLSAIWQIFVWDLSMP